MSEPTVRLAEPKDAEAFITWRNANPQIDPKDLTAATKTNNPTCLFFAVEIDGEVVAFAPLYAQMILPYLVFSPKTRARDRKRALKALMGGVSAVAKTLGIREIGTLSKEKYPVAKWALKHGFELDPRQFLKWKLTEPADDPAEA